MKRLEACRDCKHSRPSTVFCFPPWAFLPSMKWDFASCEHPKFRKPAELKNPHLGGETAKAQRVYCSTQRSPWKEGCGEEAREFEPRPNPERWRALRWIW